MKLLTASALIAATGVLVAGGGYTLSVAAPWVSEEACIISVSKSESAALALGAQACRDRFSYEPVSLDFSQDDINAIDGTAGFVLGRFSASIYNGSPLTITSLTIVVMDPETADSDDPISHYYEIDTNIAPRSSGDVSFDVFNISYYYYACIY